MDIVRGKDLNCAKDFAISKLHRGAARSAMNRSEFAAVALEVIVKFLDKFGFG